MTAPRLRVLLSYWYMRTLDTTELQATFQGADVILDSGAFSAHTSGSQVDVDAYATWLRGWAGNATAAFSLDVIGDPVASLRNYQTLIDADTGIPIVPVFHGGTNPRHLDRLLDDGVTYLGFGGLVEHARRRTAVTRWAAWNLRRCTEAGATVHALGATGTVTRDLPFYSADSSTWMMAGRGYLCTWNPRKRLVEQVMFRNPERVASYAASLRESGYDVPRISRPDFMARGEKGYAADRAYAFQMSARAYFRMEQGLSCRRTVQAPHSLAPHTDPGTKVYLAATTRDEFDHLLAAWAAHTTERTPV